MYPSAHLSMLDGREKKKEKMRSDNKDIQVRKAKENVMKEKGEMKKRQRKRKR